MTQQNRSMTGRDSADPQHRANVEQLFKSYDSYEQIEEEFNNALDQSLNPRGPEMLFDLVAELDLPSGAICLDVGCGDGRHAIELARRFGLNVHAIDPVPRHIELARATLAQEARTDPSLTAFVQFDIAWADKLPAHDESVDLIWCRDVLELVPDLKSAYAEIRRVLKPNGKALVYQMFATSRLDPREWLEGLPLGTTGADGSVASGLPAGNMWPEDTEATIGAVGLQAEDCIAIGSEWGESAQERTGMGGRKLLHAARLLRDPSRYIQQFGAENYQIALADCLWHVYRLLGKLSYRIYLLSPAN